jgi:hypothetical protein
MIAEEWLAIDPSMVLNPAFSEASIPATSELIALVTVGNAEVLISVAVFWMLVKWLFAAIAWFDRPE